jgi:uncharacterized protein
MGAGVLEAFTRRTIEAQPPRTREIQFCWQGGEPALMGVPFFRRAIELQQRYARPGMRVGNALQTNGTLLDDSWGRFLREHDFLVGISVDGPEEMHDAWRRDRRGRGSFQRVMRGLDVLKKHGVAFNTLTVVHARNGSHPERMYGFLKGIGSTFLQFIPLVEPDGNGGVSPRSVGPEQYGRFLTRVFDRWLAQRDVGRVIVRDFDAILGLVMGLPSALCVYAETCGRALAIEHTGDVFSCDHFVDEKNRLGNVLDAPIAEMVDGERQVAFGSSKRDALPGVCRECEHLRLCRGGCPKDRIAAAPGGEVGLNHLCAGYALFFDHALPVLRRMAHRLRRGRPARDFASFDVEAAPQAAGARPDRKRGRNEPCPCGSGRKYKRCCLRREML